MDRITLVELIEGETAKLSPRGRELWEEMETLIVLSEEISPRDRRFQSRQREIADQMLDLPLHDQHVINRVEALSTGLAKSDEVEKQGESGERYRNRAVIIAAGLKDKDEGRQIDPDVTLEQAFARLRQ